MWGGNLVWHFVTGREGGGKKCRKKRDIINEWPHTSSCNTSHLLLSNGLNSDEFVGLTYYSDEVENLYTILQQIYWGNGVPNFVSIARVLWEILQETFWSLFFWTQFVCCFCKNALYLCQNCYYFYLFFWYAINSTNDRHQAKAGMVHSVSGCMWNVQIKLWDPLRTQMY